MNNQCAGQSLYNQIAQKLIADIEAGVYHPGQTHLN